MSTIYNIVEVFELAQQIERNGSAFYRAAARAHGDEKARAMLQSLAAMEDQHEVLFARLAETVAATLGQSGYDPEAEALAYLQVAARSHIFNSERDPQALVNSAKSIVDVLRVALQVEKDTVALFSGLRDVMPESWGRGDVALIIDEEKRHVVMLSTALSQLLEN